MESNILISILTQLTNQNALQWYELNTNRELLKNLNSKLKIDNSKYTKEYNFYTLFNNNETVICFNRNSQYILWIKNILSPTILDDNKAIKLIETIKKSMSKGNDNV